MYVARLVYARFSSRDLPATPNHVCCVLRKASLRPQHLDRIHL